MKPERYANPSLEVVSYWNGFTYPWQDWTSLIEDPNIKASDVALFTGLNDLVVVDCDVVRYEKSTGRRWHYPPELSAPQVEIEVRYGINDLQREVERLGHHMTELATYTVRTKSGGFHLYYRVNPRFEFKKKSFRENWHVDVLTGTHVWVGAPPTPGYAVVRDRPVIELPDWLAEWLSNLNSALPPVGGQRRVELSTALLSAQDRGQTDADLRRRWLNLELKLIQLSNRHGGWNQTINDAAWRLFSVGYDHDTVVSWIREAAEPLGASNERKMLDTINSAWRAAQSPRSFEGGPR